MSGISEVSTLIAAIHDCAEGDDRWQDALKRASRFLGVNNFAIGTIDPDRDFFESINLPIDPVFEQSYLARWAPRNFLVKRSAMLPPGTLFSFDTAMPRAEFRKTPFYNEWWHPQGMDQAIGTNLVSEGFKCVFVTAYRPLAAPEFSGQDAERFRVLLPHLQRAMQLRERLRTIDRYAAGACAALATFGKPAILLTREGRFLHANQLAERLIADRSLRLGKDGSLEAAVPDDTRNLRHLIYGAVSLDGRLPGGRMVVRREARAALVLVICPLPRDAESGASAIIFVEDPEGEVLVAPDGGLLRSQYHLTQAEADLAILLLGGDSLRQAAKSKKIAYSTARTHLARTFEKTGVNSQPALMRLLTRSGHGW